MMLIMNARLTIAEVTQWLCVLLITYVLRALLCVCALRYTHVAFIDVCYIIIELK